MVLEGDWKEGKENGLFGLGFTECSVWWCVTGGWWWLCATASRVKEVIHLQRDEKEVISQEWRRVIRILTVVVVRPAGILGYFPRSSSPRLILSLR